MNLQKYNVLRHLIVFSSAVLLLGCASGKDDVIPNDGVPIEQVYFDQVGAQGEITEKGQPKMVFKRRATMTELDNNPYIVSNTLVPVFKKLENPTLYIFSFPYLSDNGRVPVPAYISEMNMFEREEYALPGEVNLNMGEVH